MGNFYSTMDSPFLRKPGYLVGYGNYWILVFFLILFGVALFIPYNEVLQGEVLISGQKPSAQVQAGSSGEIANIFFSPGDKVEPNDVLAVIDNPANYTDVQYLRKQLVTQYQIRDLEMLNVIFPRELQVGPELQLQYLNMIKALQLQILKQAFDGERHMILHSISQEQNKKEQLKIKMNEVSNAEKSLELVEANLLRYQNLFDKGVIAKLDLEKIEREFLEEQENLQERHDELEELKFQFSGVKNQSRLIRNSEIEEEKLYETAVWGAEKELWNAISVWEEKYLLRSTIQGTLNYLDVWGANQLVSKNDVIFKISSHNNQSYVGKSSFQNPFAGKIEAGTKALIRLNGYPSNEWGVLEASVSSASLFYDGTGSSRQIVYYHIPQMITSSGRNILFEQELIGQVEILLNKATVLHRLINFLENRNENGVKI